MFRNAINFLKAIEFLKDRRGNIAPIFALSLIPTVGMIGAAVDYSRASSLRTAMQAALDSSTLALANSAPGLTDEQLQTTAKNFFNALFKKDGTTGVTVTTKYSTTNGSQLVMTAETTVPTEFMNIPGLGIKSIPIKAESTTAWGNRRLRVALALDNTGSMDSNNKMTALKTAAKGLIDQLKTAATKDGDVYVSIIPFATDVNVGASKEDATWLDWDEWERTHGSCSRKRYETRNECLENDRTWTPAEHSTWNGCVTDREKPNDTTNAAPNSAPTRFPTEQALNCPVELMTLSYDWNALKTKIDDMTPVGNTNTTIGLEWAWHSLSQGAPLNAPAEEANYQYKKIIIFLTDGDNTENRWWSTNRNSDKYDSNAQKKIDDRMKLACANAKGTGDPNNNPNDVEIYTILVMQGSESLLKACSSSKSGTSDHYFKITKADQLVSVFNQIGTQISRLRVAR